MTEFDPNETLKKAWQLRDEKVSQRKILDHEIASLNKAIEGLAALCKMPPEESPTVGTVAQEMLKYAGLTDVVRMCLQASPVPLSAADIVAKLKDASYPVEKLDNPRAAVNTILSRLAGAGEIQRKEKGDSVLYSWIRSLQSLDALERVLAGKSAPPPAEESAISKLRAIRAKRILDSKK